MCNIYMIIVVNISELYETTFVNFPNTNNYMKFPQFNRIYESEAKCVLISKCIIFRLNDYSVPLSVSPFVDRLYFISCLLSGDRRSQLQPPTPVLASVC